MGWQLKIDIFVPGTPKAQPRARVVSHGGRVWAYTPKGIKAWKDSITALAAAEKSEQLKNPVFVRMDFILPMPKSIKKSSLLTIGSAYTTIKKPDLDNLIKAAIDALTDAGVWVDDAQIVSIKASKRYADNEESGAHIIIYQYEYFGGEDEQISNS